MKRDFDNEFDDAFDFLDELENIKHTKTTKTVAPKNEKMTKAAAPKSAKAVKDAALKSAKATKAAKTAKTEAPLAEKKKAVKKAETERKASVRKTEAERKVSARKAEAERKALAKRAEGRNGKRKRKKENFLLTFWESLAESAAEMSTGDRIVISTGALVLVMAIITGSVYLSAKGVDEQIATFAELGENLETVSISGESGLIAVTDAEVAAMNAEIVEESEITEEAEKEVQVAAENEVILNLTSVQKDLKIKFMNRASGKLISGIPFQATVKAPGGKTDTYKDEDKDGIIYKTDLTPGSYEVSIVEIKELGDYKFSTSPVKVKVKDKIEYKQIDVADEIKTEAQVNAAVEDTAVQEKEAEAAPALKDTVEWVESTKTAVGSNGTTGEYEEVDKDDIPDPMELASIGSRFRIMTKDEGNLTEGEAGSGEANTEEGGNKTEADSGKTESGDNKTESGGGKSENTTTDNSGSTSEESKGDQKEEDKKEENKEPEKPVAKVSSVSISGGSEVTVGGTLSLSAKVEGENLSEADKGVTWSSSDKAVAAVNDSGTVTGIKAGKATITAASKKDGGKTATCSVTVKDGAVTISLSSSELSLKAGENASLTAKVSRGSVKWSSDNEKVATVSDGKVTAVAEGTAVIKAVSSEDGNVSASCKVTVKKTAALTVAFEKDSIKVYTDNTVEAKISVSNASGDVTYSFETKDKEIATGKGDNAKAVVKGVKAGETKLTVTAKDASGATATAECKITVILNPKKDKTSKLKDEDGNQLYILEDGKYREAVYADYYEEDEFYKKAENVTYTYTGWQTINGKTYFYDKNGKPVTGEQIIQGAKYVFGSDGALATNSSSGIMGIDVSKWNGTINWTAVKNSGVNYVIIRCGYRGSSTGALIQDPKFKANIQGAAAAGIKVGVYFFTQAVNEVEAVEEASMTLDLIKGYKLSYPVFIDVESSGGRADGLDKNTRTAVVNAFCKTIQNAGYNAGIYANKTWFESKMNTASLSGYKIWLAQYKEKPTYQATRYDMWQYTSKGKISGISGNVDMNISYLGY